MWLGTKVTIWACGWAFPVGAIGVGLVATVFLAPLGFALLVLAAAPLVRMMNKRREEVERWKTSPTPGLTKKALEEELSADTLEDTPWTEQPTTSTTTQDTLF
jgi:hypothetical protein